MDKIVKKVNKLVTKKKGIGRDKIVGELKFHENFTSVFVEKHRDVLVWLPPSYKKEPEKSYPVLYMHDGQNLFDPKTSYAGMDWRVDETVSKLIKQNRINEIIVVGINNTNDRLDEYSDTLKGHNYISFIINELKPFVDNNYRTKKSPQHTAMMGSSMGGLISFLIAWNHSDIFSMAACMSSSFYYQNEIALRIVKEYEGKKKPVRIYIDHGEDGLIHGQQMFIELSRKGYIIGTDIDYFYSPGASHNENEWAARLERPILFFFKKNPDEA